MFTLTDPFIYDLDQFGSFYNNNNNNNNHDQTTIHSIQPLYLFFIAVAAPGGPYIDGLVGTSTNSSYG